MTKQSGRHRDANAAHNTLHPSVSGVANVASQGLAREEEGTGRTIYVDVREAAPRDFYLTQPVAEKFGYTRGCAGCQSWFKGRGRAPHSAECRERFRNLLREDAKVKNAEARKKEFEEREMDRKRREEQGAPTVPAFSKKSLLWSPIV